MRRSVLLVLILSLVLGFMFWKYSATIFNKANPLPKQANLIYWGTFEDEAVMRPVIESYQGAHPNTKITYVKQSVLNYRTRVQTQLRAGQGPDIFEIHNSWLPMFSLDIAAAPSSFMTVSEYSATFYPLAKNALISGGKIWAVPLEVNGLAMYYNEDVLKAAGVVVPKSWQEFVEAAKTVTVRNQDSQIQTSGAALGSINNIDYWPEILGLLFLQQPNVDIANPATPEGTEVLQFYTSFITDPRTKTWDTTLPSSTQMFTEGKLAFYFAPYEKAAEIKAANPALNFKVAPVPQLPGRNMVFGGFWVAAVSSESSNQNEAWDFVKFLTSDEVLQQINEAHTQAQMPARLYPRADMVNLAASDALASPFVLQAPFYKNWYLNSQTQDVGINEEMITLFGGAVEAVVLQGLSLQEALQNVARNVPIIIDKYTQTTPAPSK